MPRRRDLNSFSAEERQDLVNLMLQYITDAVVNLHPLINHSGAHLFTGHRTYIEDMENWLSARGEARFVPLPKWDPATRIPAEFNVVKPFDNGTPRPPLVNLNPQMPMPVQFAAPAVCSFANADLLGNAANPWHGNVHVAVGGTMSNINQASAAPIFWCWHAFVDEIYYDWQQCSRVRGWKAPTQVPGWFGWENQGGGVAIANISGTARPDLIVFHIDNPQRDNRGYYRIGWDLDANGNVTGWTDPKQVPGWFGWENQGGGIAVADVHGHGQRDLIVFHIDNPQGDNRGYYRIGWHLNTNGVIGHGWTNPKPVPGWFGWENQGGGVAVADLEGNGRPDLVALHIDNPERDNHGYYRIGWNLDTNGDIS